VRRTTTNRFPPRSVGPRTVSPENDVRPFQASVALKTPGGPGMSTLTGSVYGWLSEQTENQMEIDRRSFLTGGLACAGLAVLAGTYPVAGFISVDDLAADYGLHPFTVSLLERVAGARSAVDRSKVERFIRQRARYLGHPLPPVIKWLPGPQAAFDHLSRHGFLERYLERLVHKTASQYDQIVYIDGLPAPGRALTSNFRIHLSASL